MNLQAQTIPEDQPLPRIPIHRPSGMGAPSPSPSRARGPVRLMILDHDAELVRALSARANQRGWESHLLSSPTTRRLLARMRIDALLVDPAAIGPDPWGWLGRVAAGLPGVAVVVAAGPSTVNERIHALALGIDDWLEKPSHPDELIERIASAVRRRRGADSAPGARAIVAGEIEIRVSDRRVFAPEGTNESVQLTEREFGVLEVLAAHEGLVVERERVYSQVWGYTMVAGDRSVDVHVRKVRAKLRRVSPAWAYIHTQFRIGYRFQPERISS